MKILCINTRKGIGDQVLFISYIHAISTSVWYFSRGCPAECRNPPRSGRVKQVKTGFRSPERSPGGFGTSKILDFSGYITKKRFSYVTVCI